MEFTIEIYRINRPRISELFYGLEGDRDNQSDCIQKFYSEYHLETQHLYPIIVSYCF